jgi:carboxylesterase
MPGGEENGERSRVEQRVMKGAEPFRFEGNGTGVLVSHGFTGTTQSVRPLGEALAEEGFTVMGPRLAGHGTSMEDHAQSTALDWISSIEEGLTWLRQRTPNIFFAGLSMGGMFALYFAATRPELVRGIIPINACVFLNAPDLARVVFDPQAPATVPGVGSDVKAEGVEELVYPEVPVPPLKEFMALMRVTDDLLPTITAPALILQSTEDHVVPPENGPHIQEKLGSEDKELVRLENSYHVAPLDNDKDLIAERTTRFIREHGG